VLLTRLSLHDVRNYADLEFEPPGGLSVIVGPNGQGKSNLLEAIGILATGRSFRTAQDQEVVRAGTPQALVLGEARLAAGIVRLACAIVRSPTGARKRYELNGHGVRFRAYLGRARVVTFVPADLELAAGPPARRRALLNAALAQRSPVYYDALAQYTKFLAQKNAMLRGMIPFERALLDTYDERLIATGTELVIARRRYVAALGRRAQDAYAQVAADADGPLEVRYLPDVDESQFAERFLATRSAEIARKRTLVGPHRDDLGLSLGGKALAAFGSQGQQRSAVLALKVAEYSVRDDEDGESPLMLLDDVLSELDAFRKSAFLEAIDGVEQAFVTATEPPAGLRAAATYRVAAGSVERVA
jgi:DNA replication and repair protein RecF